jgi:hypothetical protein
MKIILIKMVSMQKMVEKTMNIYVDLQNRIDGMDNDRIVIYDTVKLSP